MAYRPVAMILHAIVFITSLLAAWFWYQSAAVDMPTIDFHLDAMTVEKANALNKAFADVAGLNQIAAALTAASTFFVAVSSVWRWVRSAGTSPRASGRYSRWR
jgi:uncharacterized membrane protein YfcA